MIESIKGMGFLIRVFLLVAMLGLFTLNVENASADSVLPDAYSAESEQGEIFLAANQAQQPQQQDVEQKEMKNDPKVKHMMGHGGGGGSNWLWTVLLIVLMVAMMA